MNTESAIIGLVIIILVIICALLLLMMKSRANWTMAGSAVGACVCADVAQTVSGGAGRGASTTTSARVDHAMSPQVRKEYEQWLTNEGAIRSICSQMPPAMDYEARAIFERYFMSVINAETLGVTTEEIERKMREEILAKGIARDDARADEIVAKIRAPEKKTARANDELVVGEDMVRAGIFIKRMSPDRLALLRARAESHMAASTKQTTDELIGAMILRYASLSSQGQNWAVPNAVYDVLHDAHGARFEAFASPLNSSLLRFDDTTFASAFPDVDAMFGSVGSFFSAALDGKVSVVNPPFVEAIMDRVADKCIADCASATSARMFVIVPEWSDSAFYEKLSRAPCLEERITLPRGRAYFESEGKAITTTFNVTVFVLSVGMPRESYDDIVRAWAPRAPLSISRR